MNRRKFLGLFGFLPALPAALAAVAREPELTHPVTGGAWRRTIDAGSTWTSEEIPLNDMSDLSITVDPNALKRVYWQQA